MPANSHTKQFLSVAEFSQLTGDSQSTVRREIRAGNLPYRQSGPRKKIKIPIAALENPSIERNPQQIEPPKQVDDQTETFSGPQPDWLS
ncbi:hypothetical protein MFFC18_19500 [Mariniblastus fucicola]|uniref:Helix-turn-helix domain protein n=1 Tax=Mariniblastus fucicola TaxID=980251 RepID=A0A5B9P9G9_9BACT|nr:hypothetical protein MFFC18_19500 [Mariniblastus fucicola]